MGFLNVLFISLSVVILCVEEKQVYSDREPHFSPTYQYFRNVYSWINFVTSHSFQLLCFLIVYEKLIWGIFYDFIHSTEKCFACYVLLILWQYTMPGAHIIAKAPRRTVIQTQLFLSFDEMNISFEFCVVSMKPVVRELFDTSYVSVGLFWKTNNKGFSRIKQQWG